MSIYCFSDLHGIWSLWEQIRDFCEEDDKLYFLGDAADRGPDGIKIMQDIMKDKRVTYIKGNHEDMLLNYALSIGTFEDRYNDSEYMLLSNGGDSTIKDFLALSKEEQNEIITNIKAMPQEAIFINRKLQRIILNHSGFYSEGTDRADLCWYVNDNPYLWDRRQLNERKWKGDKDTYLVHGHTAAYSIIKKLNEYARFYDKPTINIAETEWINNPFIVNYCEGHKFGIDLASYASKKAVLFDLDELKVVKTFTAKE
jgi:serine/threonine protein phosphatase 1